MSQYSGPLQKMIDAAVEKQMSSALKNTEDEDMANRRVHNLGSNVKTLDGVEQDVLMEFDEVAPDEHYQELGYENREEFIKDMGRGGDTDAKIQDDMYHSSKFYESANPVDISKLNPQQRERLTEVYGGEGRICLLYTSPSPRDS